MLTNQKSSEQGDGHEAPWISCPAHCVWAMRLIKDLHAVVRCTPPSHSLQTRSSMLLNIPNSHHRHPDLLPRPGPIILPALSSSLCRYPHFPRYQSLNPRCCPPTFRSLLLSLLHLLSFQTRPRHGSIINSPRQSSFSSSQSIQFITSFLHRFQFHR